MMDKDGFWAVDLFPVFLQTQGENPKNQWSAAHPMVTVISLADELPLGPIIHWKFRGLRMAIGEWG
jgi:hypothetical protein